MHMNKLQQTRLFCLLSDASQECTYEEMQEAYEDFVEQMQSLNTHGEDYSEIFRILNNTCIEVVFMESLYPYGREKKCTEKSLPSKSISLYQIGTEIV